MRIESLQVSDSNDDRQFTAQQVIDAIEGATSSRLTMPATYVTPSVLPTVYFTATDVDGNVITSRRTSGITLDQGFYIYDQPSTGYTSFVATWDEGDPDDSTSEWIVIDL